MIDVIENINTESEIAYFVRFNEPDPAGAYLRPPDEYEIERAKDILEYPHSVPSIGSFGWARGVLDGVVVSGLSSHLIPDKDEFERAKKIIDRFGSFPDIDLIYNAATQGVVRKEHKRLLKSHLEQVDLPVDEPYNLLLAAEDRGEIESEVLNTANPIISFNWRPGENFVYDAEGRSCVLDEAGNTQLKVFKAPEDLDEIGDVDEHLMSREYDLDAFIWQSELRWVDGHPEVIRHSKSGYSHAHITLGRMITAGEFAPVLTSLSS